MTRIALFALALVAVTAVADEKKAAAPDEKAAQANMEKHATPGEHHKKLEPLVGNWTYTAKFWMAPGAPAIELTGTAKCYWIMGGRFLREEVNGPVQAGMPPFEGVSTVGYDNFEKKYVGTWVDSMTTSIIQMTGDVDAAGKTIIWLHEDYDPVFGQKLKMKDVNKITGPDSRVMTFYKAMPDGKEMKAGEITYARKK